MTPAHFWPSVFWGIFSTTAHPISTSGIDKGRLLSLSTILVSFAADLFVKK
jgi:hypothetical protein